VLALRAQGVEAFGWLPSDRTPEALADYVNAQAAQTVVIPREVAELDGLAALLSGGEARSAEALEERSTVEVVVA
jgi:hypothetical protein